MAVKKRTKKKATLVRKQATKRSTAKKRAPTASVAAGSAPVSDAAIVARTGRTWKAWVEALDSAGARELSHTDIALLVHERFGVGDWWAQSVTVGYERLTGKRANLQKAGGFAASGSLSVAADVGRLYDAAVDAKRQRKWLPTGVVVHKATRPKSMRATAANGSKSISFYFYAKGAGKSQLTVQQEKLATQASALKLKRTWAESLRKLAALAVAD
jgi:hypothetical protein